MAATKKKPKRQKAGVVGGGLDQEPLPAIGFVRFRAVDHEKMGLVAELDGDVTPAGYGSFDVTDRPGHVGITSYAGRKPLTLTIPLLFDGWPQTSVEDNIRMLERLHGLDSSLDRSPVVIVEGFGVPHSYSRAPQNRFVFTGDPQWGEDIRYRASDGQRVFMTATVTAMLLSQPASLSDAVSTSGTRHYYTVPKSGSPRTLRGIAKKYGKTWQSVRKLNPKLGGDPDHALKAGTKVRYS